MHDARPADICKLIVQVSPFSGDGSGLESTIRGESSNHKGSSAARMRPRFENWQTMHHYSCPGHDAFSAVLG